METDAAFFGGASPPMTRVLAFAGAPSGGAGRSKNCGAPSPPIVTCAAFFGASPPMTRVFALAGGPDGGAGALEKHGARRAGVPPAARGRRRPRPRGGCGA